MLLADILRRMIRDGSMTLIDAKGTAHRFGQPAPGRGFEDIVVRLHDRKLHCTLPLNPHLVLAEAYIERHLPVERGPLHEFLDLLGRNISHLDRQPKDRTLLGSETL